MKRNYFSEERVILLWKCYLFEKHVVVEDTDCLKWLCYHGTYRKSYRDADLHLINTLISCLTEHRQLMYQY